MNPEFTSLVDMEELQMALETVTADLRLLKEYVPHSCPLMLPHV